MLDAIGVFLLTGVSAATWQQQFTGPMSTLMTERVAALNAQFDKYYPPADLLRQEWFNEYTIRFAQPINATTEEAVRRLIEQGMIEGWSVPTVTGHLDTLFRQWITGTLTPDEFAWFDDRMPEWRRELIARDQTMRALNTVSYRLYSAWGVEKHTWEATDDARTRAAHAAAHGQTVSIGTPFNVGGEPLMYPGDSSGSPSNTIQCRCVTVPQV